MRQNMVQRSKIAWLAELKDGMSVACFKDGSDDMIGLHLLYVNEKNTFQYKKKMPIFRVYFCFIEKSEATPCEQYIEPV